MAALALGTATTGAVAGGPAAPGTPITVIPFYGSGDVHGVGTGLPGSATANAAVAAACNAGAPIFGAQWYTLPTAPLGRLVAHVDAPFYPHGVDFNPTGTAWVNAKTGAVLGCGSAPFHVPSTVSVSVVAYYSASVATCGADDNPWCADGAIRFAVTKVTGPPANDQWQHATPVASLPFSATVDLSLADGDGPDLIDYGTCMLSTITPRNLSTAWWSYTPTVTGTLPLAIDVTTPWNLVGSFVGTHPRLSVLVQTPDGPVLAPRDDPEDCDSPTTLHAGTTYLIAASVTDDAYEDANLVKGGPVNVRFGAVARPRVPGVSASTDAAAHTATLSWSTPAAGGSAPVTGYLVTKTRIGGGGFSVVWLPATTHSHTFHALNNTRAYRLAVRAVSSAGWSVPGHLIVSP